MFFTISTQEPFINQHIWMKIPSCLVIFLNIIYSIESTTLHLYTYKLQGLLEKLNRSKIGHDIKV